MSPTTTLFVPVALVLKIVPVNIVPVKDPTSILSAVTALASSFAVVISPAPILIALISPARIFSETIEFALSEPAPYSVSGYFTKDYCTCLDSGGFHSFSFYFCRSNRFRLYFNSCYAV